MSIFILCNWKNSFLHLTIRIMKLPVPIYFIFLEPSFKFVTILELYSPFSFLHVIAKRTPVLVVWCSQIPQSIHFVILEKSLETYFQWRLVFGYFLRFPNHFTFSLFHSSLETTLVNSSIKVKCLSFPFQKSVHKITHKFNFLVQF